VIQLPGNGLLGTHVERLRAAAPKDRRLSRTQLAAALEVDRSTVTKWALGKAGPRNVQRVADVLGVTVAEIYTGKRARRRAA
jgi:transcriptional regulator with XRE-family HTH domain